MKPNSKVIRKAKQGWETVQPKVYKTAGTSFKDITRFSLLGEGENEHELNMQTRVFRVLEGGYSSLEYHRHPHSVMIIEGKGSVILGDEVHDLNTFDVVYISPETLHQFHADKGAPLSFLCVVDRYRDRPAVPDEKMLDEIMGDSEARRKARL
ncbi:MAG: cupin domain-containing protein [Balneolales bacterium]|nr:cupin domain-containing protein [Balneolales bacterium]